VQIGGGVRVGDAFQAIVGLKLVAIWVTEFCVEISQARRSRLVCVEQEKYETGLPATVKAKYANG
jgi:hypothetical protein